MFSYYQKQILRWKITHRKFNGSKFPNNTCGGWRKQDCQQEKMESYHESTWYSLFLSFHAFVSICIFFILLYQDLVYLLFQAHGKRKMTDWLVPFSLVYIPSVQIPREGRIWLDQFESDVYFEPIICGQNGRVTVL